ncbi:MAG: ABC transporter permease subunit [Lachnospiraceae bacterium]|nr:ABC transporter permease subunit [Lachnospiraceae bacterium]
MKSRKIGLHQFMAVPAFALYAVFFIYPLLKGIGLCFTDWDGIKAAHFVGLRNFIDFFHDQRALSDIRTTVLFTLGSAPLLNIVGLIYALLMNSEFRGKSIARMCIYMPAIISPLIMGYIWYFLLQPGRGFLYHFFDGLGHPEWFGNWMGNYKSALLVIVLVNVWQYAGMTMVIYLAGLQGISRDLYEAARIDGCSNLGIFWRIAMPLLKPAWSTLAVFSFVSNWNDYFSPLIFIRSDALKTLPLALQTLAGGAGVVARAGTVGAATLITTLPSIIVFAIFRGKVMETMTYSGIKS